MPRSTRDRIKDKRRQSYEAIERLFSNVQDIEDICAGRSEYVTEMWPHLKAMIATFDGMLKDILRKL